VMEEVKRDLIQVAQAIARVETKIAAVETGVKEAKAVGDVKELDSLRAEKIQLLAEKNKLLDKENKLLDEKSALREQENKLQLPQRVSQPLPLCVRDSCVLTRFVYDRATLQHGSRVHRASRTRWCEA